MTKESDRGLDIVLAILTLVRERSPGVTPEQVQSIEQEVRQLYGGRYVRIAKRKHHPTPEQRRRISLQVLSDATDDEILQANGISRATLYRYAKRGGQDDGA